jgi:protein-tyrosine-phosphatase
MAQALFVQCLDKFKNQVDPGNFQVLSAGIFTRDGLPASKEAIEVMAEENIDLNEHRSLSVSESLINEADVTK